MAESSELTSIQAWPVRMIMETDTESRTRLKSKWEVASSGAARFATPARYAAGVSGAGVASAKRPSSALSFDASSLAGDRETESQDALKPVRARRNRTARVRRDMVPPGWGVAERT
jgi:hypothetical protein